MVQSIWAHLKMKTHAFVLLKVSEKSYINIDK